MIIKVRSRHGTHPLISLDAEDLLNQAWSGRREDSPLVNGVCRATCGLMVSKAPTPPIDESSKPACNKLHVTKTHHQKGLYSCR